MALVVIVGVDKELIQQRANSYQKIGYKIKEPLHLRKSQTEFKIILRNEEHKNKPTKPR